MSVILCGLLMAVSSLLLENDSTDDAIVRKMMQARIEAWSKQDITGLMKDYAADADHVSSSGEYVSGRDAIEKRYKELFASGRYKGATSKQAIVRVRFPRSDVAIVDGTWASSGSKDPQGNALPDRKGVSTLVLIKNDGNWKIVSMRSSAASPSTSK